MNIEAMASAEMYGAATADEVAALEAAPDRWRATLRALLDDTEDGIERIARSTGEERDQILTDLIEERDLLLSRLSRLTSAVWAPRDPDPRPRGGAPAKVVVSAPPAPEAPRGEPVLQASWSAGEIVVWGGGPNAAPVDVDALRALLEEAGAGAVAWEPHKGVPIAGQGRADALTAPLAAALGWLVGAGAGQVAAGAGPSVRWLGEVAVWATHLVTQGQMVPTLVGGGRKGGAKATTASFRVSWVAAAADRRRLQDLTARLPGTVAVLDPGTPRDRVCRAVLDTCVGAVCQAGAARLVAPATIPVARTHHDVREAVLAGLAGRPFEAATRPAAELADRLRRWAAPVTTEATVGLTVRLEPPERDGGWLLTVEATGVERTPMLIEPALATPSRAKAQAVEAQLKRLERLLEPLRRPSQRRGVVIVDSDEAWELMTGTGQALVAAGFEVRIPTASIRRPSPRLQLSADAFAAGPSLAGAHQLSAVRWSVVLDDLELDAAAIARLAKEARPLVRVGGRWVELDQVDLKAAAEALAERAAITELSGAAILRHAVGLEGGTLGGPISVQGSGWAVDLVRGATEAPPEPLAAPEGFVGELREYQAEARGWLAFLDTAGLGGCLAMDMGLGKTPTVIAHLLETRDEGPTLVITPPAVLGNWKAETTRFAPGLRVHLHHGAGRVEARDLEAVAEKADVVLTTYGTAVRDVEALAAVGWRRVVIDEAQTIKNPASETARQLRRIPAPSRIALTGTPIENGLGDLWAIVDFTNPGLVGPRQAFVDQLSGAGSGGVGVGAPAGRGDKRAAGEAALRALNGLLVFRRTKAEPAIAAELPDKIDVLDHCAMTAEQVGLYQAVLDRLLADGPTAEDPSSRKGNVLAAITALKQICDHPAAYLGDEDDQPLAGRSGKLARLEELVESVFAAGERMLVFTHFARWGERLATRLAEVTGQPVACYHGGLSRGARDAIIADFQALEGPGVLVLSIKAGGAGLNLTAANHVVLYDRWWNPAVEDQARDRAWRIGQQNAVISHRLVCPGTVDERVEEVVAGKRHIAEMVLPASSSLADLGAEQLRSALGIRPDAIIDDSAPTTPDEAAA